MRIKNANLGLSYIDTLPREILGGVVGSHFSPKDLLIVGCVNKQWNDTFSAISIWNDAMQNKVLILADQSLKLKDPKKAYVQHLKTEENMKRGRYTVSNIFAFQDSSNILITIKHLAIISDKIFCVLPRSKLIYDITKKHDKRSLEGHKDNLRSLYVFNGKLVSGSNDCDIRIWEEDGSSKVLKGHDGTVSCFTILNNHLVSGSFDGFVAQWKGDNYEVLLDTDDVITSVTVFEGRIVTCDRTMTDSKVRIWNQDQTVFKEFQKANLPIVFDNKLVMGLSTGELLVYFNDKTTKYKSPANEIKSICVAWDKLVSGSDDGTLCIWDTDFNLCTALTTNYIRGIITIAPKEDKLVTTSMDGWMRLWEFK
ncbi:MAG: hypothetical protein JHC93_08225 [Parachlamydiales bacterium]|nr:hypothetical protein [Parachlamydiales bacterium]